jgi:hypothetical protein
MAGNKITTNQVKLYMKYKTHTDLTQQSCAAKSGFSERSARTIDNGLHHTQKPHKPRSYKTRKSGIDNIWDAELEPMLEQNPSLQPTTLMIYLRRTYIDDTGAPMYSDSHLRTLQRKVSKWKALNGSYKDVMFPQNHLPGEQALSDFTHMNDIGITINKEPLIHMVYLFRLVYSKYSYAKVILSGESFQALSEGLQEALFEIGGSPKEHRTDSLSAAYKNDNEISDDDLTDRYKSLCGYYNMIPSRNNKGKSHENGSVESSHGHLKNRIRQELLLRGNTNFDTIESYEQWLHMIVKNSNQQNSKNFQNEQQYLQKLPRNKDVDYEVKSLKVSDHSVLNIKQMIYSVPSRLVSHTVTLHIYQRIIVGFLGSSEVFKFDRKYKNDHPSKFVINYQHLIHALVRKPRSFRACKFRDQILPNQDYKDIWKHIDLTESGDTACKIMLRILKLSYDHDCQDELAKICLTMISQSDTIKIEELESQFNRCNPELPKDTWEQHDLNNYDHLLKINSIGANHAST